MQQDGTKDLQPSGSDSQSEGAFLPNFCSIRSVFIVVFFAELLAVMLSLASMRELSGFLQELSLISLLAQWIGLVTTSLLCLLKSHLKRLPPQLAMFLGWGLLLLVSLLIGGMPLWLEETAFPSVTHRPDLLLLKTLGIAAIVGLVVIHYLNLLVRWKQQAVAENNARLQALNSRIRPHFLFNSMNSIASLTRTDPGKAEGLVEDLADLFRASLGSVERTSSLSEELELARQYLNIEKQRLGDRLRVVWELDNLPGDASLPPLTLQPLLENAVYHGIEPATGGGTILITGLYRKNRMNLSIRNSLPREARPTHRQGNRLALDNIRERLRGLYDDAASLSESRVDGDYQVRIVVPYPWGPI